MIPLWRTVKTPRVPLCLPCCYAKTHQSGSVPRARQDHEGSGRSPQTLQAVNIANTICIWTFPKLPSSEVHHVPLISQEHHWQIPIIHYHYHYHPLFPLPSSELTCLRCTMSPLLPRSTIGTSFCSFPRASWDCLDVKKDH